MREQEPVDAFLGVVLQRCDSFTSVCYL